MARLANVARMQASIAGAIGRGHRERKNAGSGGSAVNHPQHLLSLRRSGRNPRMGNWGYVGRSSIKLICINNQKLMTRDN
jgi:hypothetical protein